MVANGIAMRAPLKKNGSAAGMRTLVNTCQGLGDIERTRSNRSASTDFSPAAVEMNTGKNAIKKLTAIFGGRPKPSQITKSGAMAILETVWESRNNGIRARSSVGEAVTSTAQAAPSTALQMYPRRIS